MLRSRLSGVLAALVLAGCAAHGDRSTPGTTPDAAAVAGYAPAGTLDAYKRDVAHRIYAMNASNVHDHHPQALLRAVIVLRYTVDGAGRLLRTEVLRSNRDRAAEAMALSSLRAAVPFPRPSQALLRNGRLEASESWLFDDDGRFQLRSLAQAQQSE